MQDDQTFVNKLERKKKEKHYGDCQETTDKLGNLSQRSQWREKVSELNYS